MGLGDIQNIITFTSPGFVSRFGSAAQALNNCLSEFDQTIYLANPLRFYDVSLKFFNHF